MLSGCLLPVLPSFREAHRAEAVAHFWCVLCCASGCVSVSGVWEFVCLCLWWGLALECPWVDA